MPNCLFSHLGVFFWLSLIATFTTFEAQSQEIAVKEPASEEITVDQADVDVPEELLSPAKRKAAIDRWEEDITAFESLDQATPGPDGAILLVGSSSIRLWEGAGEALAPYPVIRRGYGGAKFSDLYVFAKRLIEPHSFRAIVCFVGNDISGKKTDHEVADVEKWVRSIVSIVRDHQPDAVTLLVEVTPTPSRFDAWPKIRQLNSMLREVALTEPSVSFVATAEFYLDRDDQPRRSLFRDDNLHLNETGYQIWGSLIKRRLDEVLAAE